MSSEDYRELVDLNQVALNEFKTLVEQNSDLAPEWRQEILAILTNDDIPQNLETITKLIARE